MLVFWAMRGGGAGSWGVTTSATFQTFPTFNVSVSTLTVSTLTNAAMGNVIAAHARHIFDWDTLRAGQYFYLYAAATGPVMMVNTYFPEASVVQASTAILPFVTEARLLGAVVTSSTTSKNINDALQSADDIVGANLAMGSRLVSANVYRDSPDLVGQTYTQLLNAGAPKYVA